ncbi:ligand-dependent nuclear receptor corepressor-like protein isoform X6 [Pantherophis guttatus]|uniref:ribonuclease H n=1 Tax=Pantherophis guttatus TaxID=94885 RepID=A0ABM3Z2X4_PANGU|nr:ligand-dependent nuclear receptor corepressor-like protein isoform X6 [Pantherophis guttatus]
MQSLSSILESIRPSDFLSSIDLTEAYLHVPILPSHCQFLRFAFKGAHYQYKALPFGLSSAPRVFTKIMTSLIGHIRSHPVRLQFYLDDILVMSPSFRVAQEDLSLVLASLQNHGFSINWSKSHLSPSTSILHLGASIDTVSTTVCLSPVRQSNLRSLALKCLSAGTATVLVLSCLLGMMVSTFGITPWSRLHSRELQWLLLPFQRANLEVSSRRIRLPEPVLRSLHWWTSLALFRGSSFREPQRLQLTTDASLSGWGAHLLHQMAQGRWTSQEAHLSINLLELRDIRLALLHFQDLVEGRHILVLTDNTTAKAHVNRLGGTRSRSLMDEAHLLGVWAEEHLASITADYILGSDNIQADSLSRSQVDQGEWSISQDLFQDIVSRFGCPVLDLFASRTNHRLPRYFSRFLDLQAEATDALRSPWPSGLLYAFPPLPMIPRVIRKLLEERAQLLLVATFWPVRPWFVDLMNLSVAPPRQIPVSKVILSQGHLIHPDPGWLRLTVWRLSGSS